MNEKLKSYLILGSLALNIFLIAFVLGRGSAMLPGFPSPVGGMLPLMQDGMMPPHGMGMPRPPFIMPEMILSHEEMKAELPFATSRFKKIHELRKQFAADIKKGNLTQEQIIAHFEQIDAVMEELKNRMKEKVTVKLASMSPEERILFARELLRD